MTGDQLSMFEPTGHELASLAATKLKFSQMYARASLGMEARGFGSLAATFGHLSRSALDDAACLDSACQFEALAGLS